MCGICGEIRFDGQSPDLHALESMQQQMQARGPDEGGTFSAGSRAFGHRRLKIMDLSSHSQQPMFDASLGLGIVFNGAIYNHPELRVELEGIGYAFFSAGDTEVVLKAYHAWGADCLKRFKGMFAFAIWHRDSEETFIARDRLGIKPLYFSLDNHRFRFASTLPALLRAGDIDTGIDPVALNFYLSFHAVVPAPHTIALHSMRVTTADERRADSETANRTERQESVPKPLGLSFPRPHRIETRRCRGKNLHPKKRSTRIRWPQSHLSTAPACATSPAWRSWVLP